MVVSGHSAEDELFGVIGSFGPWQKTVFAIFFYANIVGIWQNFAMTFLAPNVPFRCIQPNVSYSEGSWPGQCSVQLGHNSSNWTETVLFNHSSSSVGNWTETVPCTRWEYEKSKYSETLVNETFNAASKHVAPQAAAQIAGTLIQLFPIRLQHTKLDMTLSCGPGALHSVSTFPDRKWDLVCDREWLISFAKSVYMIGFLLSVFIFGQMSDWIGRLPTIVFCYLICIINMFLSLFSTSVTAFLTFRFLQAFGRTGFTTTGFVLIMETVGRSHRTRVGIAIQLGWCVGYFALAMIGYFFRHWFWFQVAIAIPVLPLLLTYGFIPESPRWLMMHKKLDPLKKLIEVAAKKNGVELKEDPNEILKRLVTVEIENKGTIVDLFRTPRMRRNMFNMMYLWIVNAFVYYALSFNTNDLSGDPYLNFLVSGLLEFPSYGMLFLCIRQFGRKPTLVALMLLGGASCIALVPVPSDMAWLSTTLALCGKFCVTASFGLLYLYTSELFPTVVRSAALGTCSTVARFGSIVAPFSRELGKATHPFVPNILYCVLAITSGLFALWLPETRGRKLPDTLEEGEAFEKE